MAELAAVPPVQPDDDGPKAKKLRPIKTLPTERITHTKQLDLLRAYAAVYASTAKPVTNNDVADIVKLTASTISLANAFFADTALLTRAAEGGYVPSPDVTNFQRASEWNAETASHKLGPVIAETWFAKALTPKLTFSSMEESEAIARLAEVSAAGPDYRLQLKICVDYMVAAGLVQREGTTLKMVRSTAPGNANGGSMAAQVDVKEPPLSKTAAIATSFSTPAEGIVQFNISVKVNAQDFAGWSPDRITAFFGGIAQVLAAKGALEREASS